MISCWTTAKSSPGGKTHEHAETLLWPPEFSNQLMIDMSDKNDKGNRRSEFWLWSSSRGWWAANMVQFLISTLIEQQCDDSLLHFLQLLKVFVFFCLVVERKMETSWREGKEEERIRREREDYRKTSMVRKAAMCTSTNRWIISVCYCDQTYQFIHESNWTAVHIWK